MTIKKPLTPAEVSEAAEQFMPLYKIVADQMPDTATTEDVLKVMEVVNKLALHNRSNKPKELTFGFNKKSDTDDPENTTKHD